MARKSKDSMEHIVSFRVSRKEMQTLQSQAEQAGGSLSSLVRERLKLEVR